MTVPPTGGRWPAGDGATCRVAVAPRLETHRDDPEFKLTVSAPTNADAREIGAAIRAERRRAGEIGEDARIPGRDRPQWG